MSFQDWIFSVHLLFAATLVGGFVMSWIVVVALRSPYKARAPERTAHPEAETTLAVVRDHWDGVRRDWQHLVDEFPASLVDRAIFRHPRVGMVSLPHTLGFMQAHLHHHRRQIARRIP